MIFAVFFFVVVLGKPIGEEFVRQEEADVPLGVARQVALGSHGEDGFARLAGDIDGLGARENVDLHATVAGGRLRGFPRSLS